MENGLKELQQRLVEMLSSFQKFTQQNGMIFFLVGGSALGAVRHQGFIPWDDDVDIAMMREDFEKMEYLMSLQHDRLGEFIYSPVEKHMIPDAPIGYLYDTLHADAGYENTAKIDIHPIDGVPKSGVLKKVQKWTSLIKITPGFIFRFYMRVCKKIMTSWRTSDSEYICSLFGVAGYEREVMPKSYLLPLKEADFENKVFMIPGNYDPYLKRLYGDYKKMPPEMEQHPRHKIHELYKK